MENESKYGVFYHEPLGDAVKRENRLHELYSYTAYCGEHEIMVSKGDSVIYVDDNMNVAYWVAGGVRVESSIFAVVLRGYQCGDKTATLLEKVNLPYVNGCATRQIFPPERIGDPTLQQLTIPPHTSEQIHHIHPTARVVLVIRGRGYSIVGQKEDMTETELLPGMVCILDPMCPHHFRTEENELTVLPVHVWSSTPPSLESNHPMFNGTKEV
ncbi:Cupin_2 domain-containing protein [Vibrio owensii]|uniref:Cupin_2 domain-containing protein n=1 Tax=Vibrio owensii TaxID=696485 RepID=A0AAU9PYP2_9VIBR|nr:Cupin_2 domain-containing protein [Vibrio owensii]